MIAKCPECNSSGKLSDELAGRKVRCPRCGSNFIASAALQKKWYYADGSNKIGPIEQNQFDGLVADGIVVPETKVWCKGMAGWLTLSEVQAGLSKKWYYAEGDNKIGPLEQEQFDSLIADGGITAETMVWCKGMDGWQPLSELPSAGDTEECDGCHGEFAATLLQDRDGVRICESCQLLLQRQSTGGAVSTEQGLEYGGLISRFIAKVVDLTFMLALASMVEGLSRKLFPGAYAVSTVSPIVMGTLLLNVLLGIFYITWFVGKLGATPGKMVVKLKITDPSGAKISYGHAFGRYCGEYIGALGVTVCLALFIFWVISNLVLPFDQVLTSVSGATLVIIAMVYVPAMFDGQRRTLYDRLCNTRVLAA